MASTYGLIGFPLGHSFSKIYFNKKFAIENIDAIYNLYPLENIDNIVKLVADIPYLKGLNVTIPYKQKIIPFLSKLSPEASQINAVNTITIVKQNGQIALTGYNTDAPAFQSELTDFYGCNTGRALILGTGGASAAVAYILGKLNWKFSFVSRNPQGNNIIGYNEITESFIENIDLIVNTTPAGMFPKIGDAPGIPYQYLKSKHYLFDLVYNPENTTFMKEGSARGAKVRNGLGMLHKQAELAWNIWQSDK
jgi:shikimate dehydrogenase